MRSPSGTNEIILDGNPFNQHAVEFYKLGMFNLLGMPGYESK